MNPLASGVALALGASIISPVAAQTGDDENVLEEVIIVGVRQSMLQSAQIKRDSDGVVDAIVAEDIGKFPDTNLAESLQRITGVSIDRSTAGAQIGAEGEGQRVTVRGIGADFNLVLLNGRSMPVSSLFGTQVTTGRSFDFSNLASESVRSVEVYKTSMSSIPTGGLGATINVLTARPLDIGDRQMSFGAKAVHDESDQDSAWTPEVSGIYSDVFADGTFGVTVSAIYQEREFGYNQAGVPSDWFPSNFMDPGWQGVPAPGEEGSERYMNLPEAGEPYWIQQNILYSVNDVDRERLNGQLVLQWRPVDALTLTLDYTYSELELQQRGNDLSFWFIQPRNSNGVFTEGPPRSPLEWTERDVRRDWSTGTSQTGWKTELDSIGFNADWIVRDGLGFALDVHSSESKSGIASPFGSNSTIGIPHYYNDHEGSSNFREDLPVLFMSNASSLDPSQHQFSGAAFRNTLSRMEIEQLDLSGYFDINDRQSLDFGVMLSETNNRTAFGENQYANWNGVGTTPDDIPDDLFTVDCLPCHFDNIPGSGNPDLFPEMFIYDFATMAALREQVFPGEPARAPDTFTNDLRTKEETTAAYLQWLWNFDIGNMNSNLRVGMRYEKTDVSSSALTPVPLYIDWVAANEFFITYAEETEFSTSGGDYDNWLPNIDWNIALRDNLIFRASYGQTIGRQAWDDIQGGVTLDRLVRRSFGSGASGDPGLVPLESKNYDLSFEWYYGEGSYLSAGYFRKDVKNYVAIASRADTPFNLPHPGQGAWYDECDAATGGGGDGNAIRECIFERYGDTEFVDPVAGTVRGVDGQDPAAVFNISVPTAQRDVEIDGWEFAFQHLFGESGFGFSANYTMVDSNIAYDNNSLEDQFAVLGLSDSANLVAFYDKNGWIGRLAWNWRDKFLASTALGGQGQPNPTYTEEYQQLDGIVSYTFENGVTLFAEGFNLTDEYSRAVGRNSNMVRYVTQTGRRYGLGVRWTF
jgi:TonB-dependent receptor